MIFRASFIKIEKQEKYRIFPCAQTVFQVNYVKVGYSYPTFFAERINTDRFRLKPSDVGNPKGFVNQAQNLSGVIFLFIISFFSLFLKKQCIIQLIFSRFSGIIYSEKVRDESYIYEKEARLCLRITQKRKY